MRHGVQSSRESWYRAECAPGRTQDERGPPKAMARRLILCTRNQTDPISGFAKNGDAPVIDKDILRPPRQKIFTFDHPDA